MPETISTLDGQSSTHGGPEPSHREELALVILWSAAEPERVGEVAFFRDGRIAVLGRGSSGASSEEPRAVFVRQRLGLLEPTPPIGGGRISRRQLEIVAHDGALRIRNVGRCPLLAGGIAVADCALRPGDTLQLKGELVLLCTLRCRSPASHDSFPAASLGDFGEADAFGILGESPAIQRLREAIAWNAHASEHILLLGPSGSGKELAARATHALSGRAKASFVSRNAATIPAGLVDAELFGSLRNYPNPGVAERPGLIGEAQGGTLFLDEIAELPESVQAHLLRVLDAGGEYHRLGESFTRRADVRLVAATNRLAESLKHDLLARIPLRVSLPGLDERKEDVPLLASHLVRAAHAKNPALTGRFIDSAGRPRFAPSFVERLVAHRYTTNVREVGALLWRAMAASAGGVIRWPDTDGAEGADTDGAEDLAKSSPAPPKGGLDLGARVAASRPDPAAVTAEEIRNGWKLSGGNVSATARALGFPSRYALYRRMRKLGMQLQGWKADED